MRIGILLIGGGTLPREASQEEVIACAEVLTGADYCAQYLGLLERNMLRRVVLPAMARRWRKCLSKEDATCPRNDAAALASRLALALDGKVSAPLNVAAGLLYGTPSIEDAACELAEASCDTVILLPLLPFDFKPVTSPALDRARDALEAASTQRVRTIQTPWLCANPAFQQLLVEVIERDWEHRSNSRLLVLMPSQPKALNDEDATYLDQIKSFEGLLGKKLDIGASRIQVSYLCDFDNAKWMGPFAEKTLLGWAGGAVSDVHALCPAFIDPNPYVICEADIRLRTYFLSNSYGLQLGYELISIAQDDALVEVLVDAVQRSLKRL